MKTQFFVLRVNRFVSFFVVAILAAVVVACQPFEAADEPVRGKLLASEDVPTDITTVSKVQSIAAYLSEGLYADTLLSDLGITSWSISGSTATAATSHSALSGFTMSWGNPVDGTRAYTFQVGQTTYNVSVKLTVNNQNINENVIEVRYSTPRNPQVISEVYINSQKPAVGFNVATLPTLGEYFSAIAFNTELSLQYRLRAPQMVNGYNASNFNHFHIDGINPSAIEKYYDENLFGVHQVQSGYFTLVSANAHFAK